MKWKTLNPTQGTIAIPHQVRGIIVGIWGYAGVLPLKAFTGLFKGAGSARALQARAHLAESPLWISKEATPLVCLLADPKW